MPEFSLIRAAVNLAMGGVVAVPGLGGRLRSRRRLAVAAIPVAWAALPVGAYLYLRATMPPPSIVMGTDGRPIIRRHGNVGWLLWEDRASTARVWALLRTVATACALAIWGLARALRPRWRGVRGG